MHKPTKSGHLNGRVEITTPEILRKSELGCTNSLLSSIMELFRLGPMGDSHRVFHCRCLMCNPNHHHYFYYVIDLEIGKAQI